MCEYCDHEPEPTPEERIVELEKALDAVEEKSRERRDLLREIIGAAKSKSFKVLQPLLDKAHKDVNSNKEVIDDITRAAYSDAVFSDGALRSQFDEGAVMLDLIGG